MSEILRTNRYELFFRYTAKDQNGGSTMTRTISFLEPLKNSIVEMSPLTIGQPLLFLVEDGRDNALFEALKNLSLFVSGSPQTLPEEMQQLFDCDLIFEELEELTELENYFMGSETEDNPNLHYARLKEQHKTINLEIHIGDKFFRVESCSYKPEETKYLASGKA